MLSKNLFSKLLVLGLATTTTLATAVDKKPTKPNFVFIITDDQDLHLSSLDYMPLVKKHLADEGAFYKRHYCTIAICCPSRVSLLTGRAAHNTNVTDVRMPYG
jgi:N-acetylglucosamine-6-sulfatase